MGKIIKKDNSFEYLNDDGEITAWFSHIEEKKALIHEGSPFFKKIFYILISMGLLYLLIVFSFVH